MREVDDPHHAERQAQPDRQHPINAADQDAAENCLQAQEERSLEIVHRSNFRQRGPDAAFATVRP